jgi:hypothetical protein
VRDPALTLLRIDLDKVEYRRSQTVSARVRTLRTDYTGASGVEVALELRPVEVSESAAPLRAQKVTSSGDGEAHVEFAGLDPGAYRLLGRATLDGRAAEERATFVVRAEGDLVEPPDAALRGGVARGGVDAAPKKRERVGASAIWSLLTRRPSSGPHDRLPRNLVARDETG